jgi:hypothetical protein
MSEEKHDRREGEVAEATVLPAREAMSLISPDPGVDAGYMPDLGSVPSADADAAGSASGEETSTSEDRSEHFENRDSATSET